ncbi:MULTISPECIES: hypothetical protein [Streptomyces]|uniref:hypothetical protein n=1 Tax=Streptomyces TaxID=1883 RepID=UPI001107BD42|nr:MULTISPECIES: hypothetical protein [Streptomyces]
MPARAMGSGTTSAGRGRTRATDGGGCATGPGARVTGPRTPVTGPRTRVTGPGTPVTGPRTRFTGRPRAGLTGARAAGIPVASTPSSALRLHVPAPAPCSALFPDGH